MRICGCLSFLLIYTSFQSSEASRAKANTEVQVSQYLHLIQTIENEIQVCLGKQAVANEEIRKYEREAANIEVEIMNLTAKKKRCVAFQHNAEDDASVLQREITKKANTIQFYKNELKKLQRI